ncbi:MAG: glycogen/starch/alpha-glucan phosphorylase, partial [Lachnospiraceae bacterium]|nr:glycogen/starch/alpha-glucan phosphorylase [Lachnospiraceae bacterium]
MATQTNLQRDILVLNMEEQMEEISGQMFDKGVCELTDQETYYVVLALVKRLMTVSDSNEGEKKIYYISAEFLIGKLLSNNLINLGIYDKVDSILKSKGKSLSVIEEIEPEPSLGNGGLGRLAACFLDSIATLGFAGEGIGLNYHYGLFKQVFKDRLQTAEKNDWIEEYSWLTKTDVTFDVHFGKKKVTSRLYDVDIAGYASGINKLRLFDIESLDESLVKEGINFDKEAVEKNLTLFLYPDDSDEAGNLLRIYQQYFMVSNAAQLILREMKEKKYDLRKMYEHAVIQINDTHPTMVIPELIRILVEEKAFSMDEAIAVVSKTCAYTNHTILAEALEKWPIELFSRLLPRIYQIIEEINRRFVMRIEQMYPGNHEKVRKMAILYDGQVKMAHLA